MSQVDIVWPDVVALAPELATVSIPAQDDILARANAELDSSVLDGDLGPRYRLARIYLAAHLGAVSRRGATGASGPVISESVGRVSRTYAQAMVQNANSLAASTYGEELERMLQNSAARVGGLI